MAFGATTALALPQGENIESGSATFERPNEHILNIRADDRTVINFTSFNIAQNEAVNFIQPSSTATVLSRVHGPGASAIAGSLIANGVLFFINTSGIRFTPTAQVQASTLVASTLDIATRNFISSNYEFMHEAGQGYSQILNQGRIEASGHLVLMGSGVRNEGTIVARAGTVHLASGDRTTVALDRRGLIQVEVAQETTGHVVDLQTGETLKDAVANTGTMEGHYVAMTARTANDIFEGSVNQTGIIRANTLVEDNGVIRIVASGAAAQVSGVMEAAGGTMDVTCDHAIQVGANIHSGSLTLDALGPVTSLGIIDAAIFTEHAAALFLGGTLRVGVAYFDNLDDAVTYNTGNYSGILTDNADIIINNNAVITLTADTTFHADNDISGAGAFTMNTGSSIVGGGYNLTLYASSASALQAISGVAALSINQSKAGSNPTYTANSAVSTGTFTLNSATYNANGKTTTTTGLVTIAGGVYQASTATQTFGGGLTVSGGTFTGSSGTVDSNGSVILSAGTLTAPSGTMNVSGDFTVSGSPVFSHNSGTVIFDGTTNLTSHGIIFNKVTVGTATASGALTLADNADINGVLSFNTTGGTAVLDSSGRTVNYAGATLSLTNADTFTATGSTWIFDGTTTLTSAGKTFNNITIGTNTASGSLTLGDTADINGTLTFNTTFGTAALNATSRTVNYAGSALDLTSADTFTTTGSTWIFDGTTTLTSAGKSFVNATIGTNTASGALTLGDNADINGTLAFNTTGGTAALNATNRTVNYAGATLSLTNADTFTTTGSTWIFDGTTSLTSAGKAFNNITIGTNTASGALTLSDTADINGTLAFNTTFGTAALNATSRTVNYAGSALDLTSADTFTTTGSTWIFDGTTTLTSAGKPFINITVGTATASGALTLGDSADINGTLAFNTTFGTAALNATGHTVNYAGSALDLTSADTFTTTDSTWIFDGASLQTITGPATWNNLTINNTYATPDDTHDIDPDSAQTVAGTLTITRGQYSAHTDDSYKDVTIANDVKAILKPDPGAVINVSGNWTNAGGTFTPNAGTVTFNGASQLIGGSNTFYNLAKSVTAAGALTFGNSATQTITHALTLAGAAGELLALRSSSPGVSWDLDASLASVNVSYVDVKDATSASLITPSFAADSGNNVNWALASCLKVTGTGTMTAGMTNELAVTAYDYYGNVSASYSGVKSLTFTGPGIAPDATIPRIEGTPAGSATSVNFSSGVSHPGAVTLQAYKAETTTLDAADASISSSGDTSYDLDLTVNPGVVTTLTISSQPGNIDGTVDHLLQAEPVIHVVDPYGNPVTDGTSVSAGLASGSGALRGTSAVTSGGNATFTGLGYSRSGEAFAMKFSSHGHDSAISSNVAALLPGAPVSLSISQQPATVEPGAVIVPWVMVQLKDQYDNICSNDNTTSVHMAIEHDPDSGLLSGTLNRQATAGVAVFSDLSIDRSGRGYTLRAASGSLTQAVSLPFSISERARGTTTWTGAVSSDWDDPANWDNGLVPAPDAVVIIPVTAVNPPGLSAPGALAGLTVDHGVTLATAGHSLTVEGDVAIDGTLDAGASLVDVNGNVTTSSAGAITGTSPVLRANGYVGTLDDPLHVSVSGILHIAASRSDGLVSVAIQGGSVNTFDANTPGFVFVNGHVLPQEGQTMFKAQLTQGERELYVAHVLNPAGGASAAVPLHATFFAQATLNVGLSTGFGWWDRSLLK